MVAHQIEVDTLVVVEPREHQPVFGDGAAHARLPQAVAAGHEVDRHRLAVLLFIVDGPVDQLDAVIAEALLGVGDALGGIRAREGGGDRRRHPFGEGAEFAVETGLDARRGFVAERAGGDGRQHVCELLILGVEAVRQRLVDHAVGHALLEIGDRLLGGAARGHEIGLMGVRAEVRKHHVGHVGDALGPGGILRIDVVAVEEPLFRLDRAEVVLVDDAGAGAVQQHRSGLHGGQEFPVDHAAGLVVLRNVERHQIAPGEDLLDRVQLDPQRFGHGGGDQRVVPPDLVLEAGEPLDQQLADIPQTDDADPFPGQFAAHEFALLPVAGAGGDVRRDDVAVHRQHQRHDFFGHGVGVGAGGVHHVDISAAGVFDVDGVVAGAGADDQFQFRQGVDDLRRHGFAADDQHLGVGVSRRLFVQGFRGIEDDFVALLRQQVGREPVQFGRDQYFSHFRISPVFMDCRMRHKPPF